MADLIEIGIEVRSGSVKSATRELDQLGNSVKSAQRSASAFVEAFARQEKQLDKVVAANKRYAESARQAAKDAQVFYKGLQQANLANKSAADSADVFAKRLEQLKQKYNPLYATSRQYENMLNEINEAHRLGALNTQQFEAAQERLNKEFTQGTGAFARYQKQFSQGFNQMGVISQQVGYQVGDFLVQIQSGTNPMVAFGQQATQLLGVLYLLPAPIMASTVAIGALRISVTALIASVSIILPLLTAIGAYFLRSGEDAKKAKQEVDNYTAALENLEQKAQKFKEQRLELTTGFDPEVLAASAERIRLQEIYDRKVVESLNLEGKKKELAENLLETLRSQISAETQKIQKLYDAARLEEERLKKVKEAKEWEEGANERIAKRGTFMKYYNSLLDEAEKKAKETKEWEDGANERIAKRGTFMKYYNELLDEAKKKEEERLRLLQQAESYYTSQGQSLQTQLSLIEAEITLRKNYTDEQYIQNRLEQTKVSLMAEQNGLSNKQRQELIALTAELQDQKSELDDIVAAEQARLNLISLQNKLSQGAPSGAVYSGSGRNIGRGSGKVINPDYQYALDYKSIDEIIKELTKTTNKNTKAVKDNRTAYEKAMMTAQEFADALDNQVLNALDGVSNAFSDFLAGGLRDFKDFVGSIKEMFIKLLADMAAMALKRQILIPIVTGAAAGFGSTAAASTMAAGTGAFAAGGIGAGLAAGAAGLSSGFMGVLSGGGLGSSFANLGGLMSGSVGGMGAIGAAIPAVLAVTAVIGLFTKKTKLLDSGLRTTVEGFDVAIDTFAKTQSSRLFGLLKGKTVTSYTAAGAELSDPLVQAVGNMQQSIVSAAQTLGIGAEAFDNFSYQFKLSLKGLTEEEQLQKINEEIFKMGDAFASLTGYFSTMNELLAVAQHRYDLTTRLLQLQGNEEELIARYREQERAATHELNQDLLDQIYALEDQQRAVQQLTDAYNEASAVANQAERDLSAANSAYDEATRSVQQAANELQNLLDESLDAALGGLERAIDARKDSINDKYDTLISGLETRLDAANEAASRSAEVYSILSGALSGRSVGGITFASRQAARAYVAGGGTDAERLQAAVNTLSEPSRQLFGSFEDYARDFAITSNVLKQSKDAAEAQMTADEKTVSLLEDQIEQAQRDLEDQLKVLDEQLEAAKLQIDALKGIDTTILSVDQAMQNVRDAMTTYEQTQANHVELNTSVLSIGQAISQLASAVSAQAAAQAAAAAAQQAQAAAAAKAAEAQQKLTVAQSGAMTDVNSTAAKISLSEAAAISAAIPMSAAEQSMLNRFSGGERPDHIKLAIAQGKRYDPSVGGYRKFAMGGYHTGGLRMVGEAGPELEVTGPSRIYSNSSTRSMLSNPELVAEIKELRREIADTKAEQRAANVAMVKYNKRTSDQLRTWNAVGLPQERTV